MGDKREETDRAFEKKQTELPLGQEEEKLNRLSQELPISPDILKEFKGKEGLLLRIIQQTTLSITTHTYPPTQYLKELDEIIPGAGDLVLNEFKEQGSHRRNIETIAITSQSKQGERGQNYGFILAIITLLMGGLAMWLNHIYLAYILFTATLLMLLLAFITGKSKILLKLARVFPFKWMSGLSDDK